MHYNLLKSFNIALYDKETYLRINRIPSIQDGCRFIVIISCLLFVTGCSVLDNLFGVKVPVTPVPKEISERYVAIIETRKEIRGEFEHANDYAQVGYGLVDSNCSKFFEQLTILQQHSDFTKSQTNLTGGATAAILGTVDAAAKAIALTAVGFVLAEETIGNYQKYALLAPYATNARRLVGDAQALYIANAAQPKKLEFVLADRLVGGYARLCNVDKIVEFVNEAIQNAVPEIKEASTFKPSDRARLAVFPLIGTFGDDEIVKLFFYLADAASSRIYIEEFKNEFSETTFAELVNVNYTAPPDEKLTPEGKKLYNALDSIKGKNTAFRNAVASYEPAKKEETTEGALADAAETATPPVLEQPAIPNVGIAPK